MQTSKDAQRDTFATPIARNLSGHTASYLGPDLQIKGEIIGNEDLRLDSKVEGLVSIGGFRLTVGPSAQVIGDIVAREALISGKVTGDISACDRIEIKKNSTVVGGLNTGKIIIEEGAYFKGIVETGANNKQIGTDLDSLLSGSNKAKES